MEIERRIEKLHELIRSERAINEINSELTVNLGPPLSDTAADMADLPRRLIYRLFDEGRLTTEEYGAINKERIRRSEEGEVDPRPPAGAIDPDETKQSGGSEAFLDIAVRS
ncbi:MAG: hypothetical protein J07HX5_00021 [halophilic archaeon J07HX5]|jgi:hypothetical protein|nr:MAG: hypothetical protein J07HX5_00021 [halophilic archaeon J07HX5]